VAGRIGVGRRIDIRLSPTVVHEFKPLYRFNLTDEGRVEYICAEGRRCRREFGMRLDPGLTKPITEPQPTVWNANTTSSINAYFFIPYLPVT